METPNAILADLQERVERLEAEAREVRGRLIRGDAFVSHLRSSLLGAVGVFFLILALRSLFVT